MTHWNEQDLRNMTQSVKTTLRPIEGGAGSQKKCPHADSTGATSCQELNKKHQYKFPELQTQPLGAATT